MTIKWINDRYKILGQLGSGGSSQVYTAIDTKDEDRPEVAIKVLGQLPNTDQEILKEFFDREVGALSKLSHPIIVRLLDSGYDEENQLLYLVLEYIEGAQSLRKLLPKWQPDPLHCADFVTELLEAISYAHLSHIIHRDLNPNNILIDKNGNIKIIDFGISKILGRLTTGQTVKEYFTRSYASPEQVAHQSVDYTSDIYSLAAILYFMLAQKDPELSSSLAEQLSLLSKVPSQICEVVQRMAADTPTARYRTASLAAQALKSAKQILQKEAQKVYVVLTKNAVSNLYDQAVTNSQEPSAARAVVDAALASEARIALPDPNTKPDECDLIGDGMSLRCILAEDRSHLIVRSIQTGISPHALEQKIQNGYRIPARLQAKIQGEPIPSDGDIAGLLDEANDFFQHKIVEQKRRRRRMELVETWQNLLDLERELKAQSLNQVGYTSWEQIQENSLIRAQLLRQEIKLDEIFSPGQLLTMPSSRGRVVPVGYYYQQDGKHILISKLPGIRLNDIAKSGRILVDERQWAAAWNRQRTALYTVVDGHCANSRLPDILLDPKQARRGIPEPLEKYFNSDLDEIKQNAVRSALSARDIYLIQGPPGTGKTVLISEIIAQILSKEPGARILLVSQSNVAVDHALTKVGELAKENKDAIQARIVRVGREELVGLGAGEYLVDQRLKIWTNQVRERSKNYLVNHSPVSDDRRELEDLLDEVQNQIRPKIIQKSTKTEKLEDKDLMASLDILGHYFPKLKVEPTERFIDEVAEEIKKQIDSKKNELETTLENWQKRLNSLDEFEDAYFHACSIISGTCVGIAGKRNLPDSFNWVIVDEAGRATPSEILIALVRAERSILVGDHKQLPPVIEHGLLKKARGRDDIDVTWLDKSLFEYLFDHLDDELKTVLKIQYRMHPHIAKLISSCFYDRILETGVESDKRLHNWEKWPTSVVWYSTSQLNNRVEEIGENGSKYNLCEIKIIEDQLLELEQDLRRRKQKKYVGVIAGYIAQTEQLERKLDSQDKKKWQSIELEINTVDAFQGREQDIVFYSVVRSNRERKIGFLDDVRRLNVALSRARELLFIVGDHEMVAQAQTGSKLNPFRELIAHINGHQNECTLQVARERL